MGFNRLEHKVGPSLREAEQLFHTTVDHAKKYRLQLGTEHNNGKQQLKSHTPRDSSPSNGAAVAGQQPRDANHDAKPQK